MKQNSKGVAFVTMQLLLIIAYFLVPNPITISIFNPIAIASGIAAIFGITLTTLATIQLNTRLSPLPQPKANAVLIHTGTYKYIRHPIYSGLFLFAFGWALYDGNLMRLIIACTLLVLFNLKARYEEQLLEVVFDDYPAYKAKTGRLFPKFFKRR
ncbi:isoprenylcysteine carboxylmethyltransferase family protein [Opitutaceae bacterium]|nr:isoprenylcysteine carboxylmethyltransferase family protein [Opitutaceae bacterium]